MTSKTRIIKRIVLMIMLHRSFSDITFAMGTKFRGAEA